MDSVTDKDKAVKARFIAYQQLKYPFFKHVKLLNRLEKIDYQQLFHKIYTSWSDEDIDKMWVEIVEHLMEDMNSNASIIGKTLPVQEGRKPTPEWNEVEIINKDVIYTIDN